MAGFMEDIVLEGLCDHDRWTFGCEACRYVNLGQQCREAISEHLKSEGDVKVAEARLADETLTPVRRECIGEELKTATSQVEAWDQNLEGLYAQVKSCVEAVDKIKAENKPELWAKKFQELAEIEAAKVDKIWRRAFPDPSAGKFVPENRSSRVGFTGLDRSKIPATPDCLISEGKGLEMFLYAGRHLGQDGKPRLPTTEVGENFGPAFMSPGRAISMFGLPEGLDDDRTSPFGEGATDERRSLPQTEREFRDQDLENPPTISTLSEKQQWKKLGPKKYMKWTGLLADKYNQLANTEASKPNATPDFAGFTNWLADCESAWKDNEFGKKVLPQWQSDNEKRNKDLIAKVTAASKNLSINDASLGFRSPSRFNSQLPLLDEDIKALKLTWKRK